MWGQTDHSGTYYIASRDYNVNNTTTNFYLCPTEEWAYFQSGSPYYYVYSSGCNTDKPFMTTYQCRNGEYTANNAIWIVEKKSGTNYYYIKRAIDGKYLTRNRTMGESSNAGRMRVHLESSPADDDDALFEIIWNEDYSCYDIITKKSDGTSGDNAKRKYLNVTGAKGGNGNIQELQGTSARNDGPTNNKNVGGIIGLWTATGDPNGKWYLEEVVKLPVISQATNGDVTITCATSNTTIYYTLNGSDPVVPADGASDPTGPTYKYTAPFTPELGSTGVKAVAVLSDLHAAVSKKAERTFVAYSTPTFSFDGVDKVTISAAHADATIYRTTNGDTPNVDPSLIYDGAPLTVSSTSIVKAIATHTGFLTSDMATFTITQVEPPTIQNNGSNAISITSATPDATIYYTTDGSTPTTSSNLYTTPLRENVSGVTIKAIAIKENMLPSEIGSGSVTLQCETPVIKRHSNDGFTVTCPFPASGVTIYYTTDGSTPTANGSSTTSGGIVSCSLPATIKAFAVATHYDNSTVSTASLIPGMGGDGSAADPYTIEYQSDLTDFISKITTGDGPTKHYKVIATESLDFSGVGAITQEFSGTFDGGYCILTGITHALFNNINSGTVKNVKFSGVNITTGNNVGAVCNEADGATKIYNCGILSGSVTGSTGSNAGGLVGHIKSNSNVRVVNCYNYADVSGGNSGGSYAAGIVGYNEGTVGDVRIALCMMYGNVTKATNISPVYAGNHTPNVKDFSEYNFWLYQKRVINELTRKEELVKTDLSYTAYNDQLAIEKEEYLTRFPFYRHILNTHRELASYFLFGDYLEDHVNEIGHWAVKKEDDTYKYPIIEEWKKDRKTTPTSTNNDLPNTTAEYAGKLLTTMGSNGYLSVNIKIGSNEYSASLPITDMDTLRYDYTYGKVVLPFANEYEVNTDYSKICTGWKITKVGSSMTSSVTNYNFADRDNQQKDIYNETTNPFIYAQGGYYVVPIGVTSIEITANFATAYYLSDATYDVGYTANYTEPEGLGGSTPTDFHGQTVYNNVVSALAAMVTASTPHAQAIVLVGNYHFPTETPTTKDTNPISSYTGKAFTLMSIDADNNQEPDYGWYSNNSLDRPAIAPVRFDFVPIISLGMAAKVNGSNYCPGVPIWKPRGWYEQTETTISIMNQFELDSGNFTLNETDAANQGKGKNPCILNGGYFVQIIRSNNTNCSKVSYFKIGGNAYIKEFYPGSHSGHAEKWATIVPVNVTGGQVEECFMTGYKSGATAIGPDIRFWCSGGKIGKFLGAYMDKPKQTSNSVGNVNMTAVVDHALIGRFFGGGTSENATITGNINVTINNSKVDFYCGGPEFGNMSEGKEVITNANNTKFGEYYGAGFGGTAITYSPQDGTPNMGANVAFTGYTFNSKRLTSSGNLGLATCYKFEYLMHSYDQTKLVARFITGYANFSLATTGNVTNNLTECTVEKDFYGAGCQGKVDGTVNSTLTNCTIKRNAFGGGYKATSNEVEVYPKDAPTLSVYNGEKGIFSEFGTTEPEIFLWEQGNGDNPSASDGNKRLYTSNKVTLTDLGNVEGAINITINGGYIGGTDEGVSPAIAATSTTEAIPAGGSVYGGGNESRSLSNTTVTLKGDAVIYGDVFGGGNEAVVEGSATVNIMVPETNNNNNNNGGNNNGGGN